MLTVKYIRIGGEETIYPTQVVHYAPGDETARAEVSFTTADGMGCHFTGGTVFVMNEHGKTVARYGLGESQVPQEKAA